MVSTYFYAFYNLFWWKTLKKKRISLAKTKDSMYVSKINYKNRPTFICNIFLCILKLTTILIIIQRRHRISFKLFNKKKSVKFVFFRNQQASRNNLCWYPYINHEKSENVDQLFSRLPFGYWNRFVMLESSLEISRFSISFIQCRQKRVPFRF